MERASLNLDSRDWAGASMLLAESISINEATPDSLGTAMFTLCAGAIDFYAGNLQQARRRFNLALQTEREFGDLIVLRAIGVQWTALVAAASGHPVESADLALKSLALLQTDGLPALIAGWVGGAAWVVRRFDPSMEWTIDEAHRIQRAVGYSYNLWMVDPKLLDDVTPADIQGDGRESITLEALVAITKVQLELMAHPPR